MFAQKNTASFTLGYMIKDIRSKYPEIKKLISYQDTKAHNGTIYKASNWIASESNTPLLDWTTKTRNRSPLQSTADKIRWEYPLKA